MTSDRAGSDDAVPAAFQLPLGRPKPKEGEIIEVSTLDGAQVCLAKLADGELIAFEARCPHRGAPLCHGILEDETIICLAHFWCWQVRTGAPMNPEHPQLRSYRLEP